MKRGAYFHMITIEIEKISTENVKLSQICYLFQFTILLLPLD